MQYFAENGVPQNERHINELRDGVWEFKVRAKRISFFDTDGKGHYTPKLKYHPGDAIPDDIKQTDYWWLPDFETDVRVGHSFVKTSERTLEHDIEQSLRTREGDLSHDKKTTGAI